MNLQPACIPDKRRTGRPGGPLGLLVTTLVCWAFLSSAPAFAKSAEDFLINETFVTRSDGWQSHVRVYGPLKRAERGEYVVLLPSLGRGVEDFTEAFGSNLTTRLVQRGYQVVLIQPRGIGESTGDITPGVVTLQTLVNDIKQVLDALEISQARFVGHAFGNRVARSFATLYPDYVSDVTLLAAGGQKPLSPEQRNTLLAIFITQDEEARLGFIEKAFFAPGGDASVWLFGWNTPAALSQGFAAENPDVDFLAAGGKPILLIQPAEDFIAPPEDAGRLLADQLGDQVTYVEIGHTGHALLPERPNTVAARIIAYFASSQSRGD
jgi:pimeloyl-ACP methyl ester carboxylesterase